MLDTTSPTYRKRVCCANNYTDMGAAEVIQHVYKVSHNLCASTQRGQVVYPQLIEKYRKCIEVFEGLRTRHGNADASTCMRDTLKNDFALLIVV